MLVCGRSSSANSSATGQVHAALTWPRLPGFEFAYRFARLIVARQRFERLPIRRFSRKVTVATKGMVEGMVVSADRALHVPRVPGRPGVLLARVRGAAQ
jgi:hypothetical protein